MRPYAVLLLAALLALSPEASASASANCLPYGGQVHLKGTLFFREYPGPPDYDEKSPPVTLWFVTLEQPICIDADPAAPSVNAAVQALKEIQVIPAYPPGAGAFRSLRGKEVQVSGVLHGPVGRDQKTAAVLVDTRVDEPAKHSGS